jgi:hypothetical protein
VGDALEDTMKASCADMPTAQGESRCDVVAPLLPDLHRNVPTLHRAAPMNSFFPMRRGEAATLAFLVAFAAFAFVPAWRTTEVWGMAVFGWLIAALMVLSPTLALVVFVSGGAGPTAGPDAERATGSGDGEEVS